LSPIASLKQRLVRRICVSAGRSPRRLSAWKMAGSASALLSMRCRPRSSGSRQLKRFPSPRKVSSASIRARKFSPSGTPASPPKNPGPSASTGASNLSDSPLSASSAPYRCCIRISVRSSSFSLSSRRGTLSEMFTAWNPAQPEITDLIVQYDSHSLQRLLVRKQDLLEVFSRVHNRKALRAILTLPENAGILDDREIDLLLLTVHWEMQRLGEEFYHGQRVWDLLQP